MVRLDLLAAKKTSPVSKQKRKTAVSWQKAKKFLIFLIDSTGKGAGITFYPSAVSLNLTVNEIKCNVLVNTKNTKSKKLIFILEDINAQQLFSLALSVLSRQDYPVLNKAGIF